jgi:integrase
MLRIGVNHHDNPTSLSTMMVHRIANMASITSVAGKAGLLYRVKFYDSAGDRKTLVLGKVTKRFAESIKFRMESLLSAKLTGNMDRDTSIWLSSIDSKLRSKLERVGLLEPIVKPETKADRLLSVHLADFITRVGKTKKPGTIAVWRQVESNLLAFMPKGISLTGITKGHAKQFHEHLKGRKLASLTIQKHVRISRQIMQDAVDWVYIDVNPFAGIKVTTSSSKSNVDVPTETIELVLKHCNPTWKTIVALSRFGGLRTPSETLSIKWDDVDWENNRLSIPEPKVEHHEGRGVRSCPMFPELRKALEDAWELAPDNAEFIIDKPAYRAAANTGTGWKNANLRTQFNKILRKAGVSPWARIFHSMRASRQTELERQFPLHVVCAWLGNSPKVAQRSYLLVTENDFEKASSESTPKKVPKSYPVSVPIGSHGTANHHPETSKNPKEIIGSQGLGDIDERMGRDSNPR